MYRNDGVVVFKKSSSNSFLKKECFKKNPFCIKCSMQISGKVLLHFHQESLFLISHQTYHRKNMFCLINPTLAVSQTMSAFVL